MVKAGTTIAGVQPCQAIRKSEVHVYKRLQANEIRSKDAFHVVLDIKVHKVNTLKKKATLSDGEAQKLLIPVKWTWARVQRVCSTVEVNQIKEGLATAACNKKHTHWMSKYTKTSTLGGAVNPSEEEFLVTPMIEIGHRIEQIIKELTQQKTNQWQTQEDAATSQSNAFHGPLLVAPPPSFHLVQSHNQTTPTLFIYSQPQTAYEMTLPLGNPISARSAQFKIL